MAKTGRPKGVKNPVNPATINRNLNIVAMYFENYTLEEVSQKFHITRERVRQIIGEMGYKPRAQTSQVFVETLTKNRRFSLTSRESFWSRVDVKSADECWEWQGYKHPISNYGIVSFRSINNNRYAHRFAYMFHHRKQIKNHILHSCDNPPCCNPHHLRDGTPAENVQDRNTRGREIWYQRLVESVKTRKPGGKRRKFSEEDIRRMQKRRNEGATYEQLKDEFNTDVWRILRGNNSCYKNFLQSV